MKIDLHCHTKKTKVGDPPTRNVTTELFARKVEQAKVGILAITNHNAFDYEQYCSLRDAVHEFCQVYPGVELDVHGQNTNGHLIIVVNPDEAEAFEKTVAGFITESPDTFSATIEQIVATFSTYDIFYIPHAYGKEASLSSQDIDLLYKQVKEPFRIINETTYSSLGVYSNFGLRVIAGSDVRDWAVYERYHLPELRLPVGSYLQLKLLAQRNPQVISTLLSRKRSQVVKASPHKDVIIDLRLYQDINIIFGQKGTGKSEILRSIRDFFQSSSISYSEYFGASRDETYSEFESTASIIPNAYDIWGVDDCSREFQELREWQATAPCPFHSYIDHCSTERKSLAKQRFLVVSTPLVPTKTFDIKKKQTLNHLVEAQNIIVEYLTKEAPLSAEDSGIFLVLMNKIIDHARSEYISCWVESESIALTNKFIRGLKDYADRCTDTLSRPSGTGFEEYALSRIRLFKIAHAINSHLAIPEETKDKEFLGTLEGKGNLYLCTRYRFLISSSSAKEFPSKKTRMLEAVKHLQEIESTYSSESVIEKVIKLNAIFAEYSIRNINPFIGVRKETILEDNRVYNPSSGEKGILLLQRLLNQSADVYLLDEPEAGMGNSYIKASIIPRLMKLAESGKTIVIATHNANIAVLTLPYISIFREHSNGVYRTYTGNPYSDQLINLEDTSDVRCWTTESMHTLEGGKQAFYGRKTIYESCLEHS